MNVEIIPILEDSNIVCRNKDMLRCMFLDTTSWGNMYSCRYNSTILASRQEYSIQPNQHCVLKNEQT